MALATYIPPSVTMTNIRTNNPNAVAEVWSATAILEANNEDDLSLLEGAAGSDKPFQEKTDLTKGMGDTVHFTTFAELGGSGRRGSAELIGYTEKPDEGSFAVVVDLIRHGVSHKRLVREMTATGKSRSEIEAELLGRWHGRKAKADKLLKLIKGAGSGNTIRPDGKTRDQLLTSDTMATTLISDGQGLLVTLNGNPVQMGRADAGYDVHGYMFYSVNDVLRSIKQEDAWIQAQKHAGVRGTGNGLFNGDIREWDGNLVWLSNTPDRPTRGPMGSPMAPKAKLGDAVVVSGLTSCLSSTTVDFSTGNGTIYLYGSGASQATLGDYASYYLPFEWFPGYDYLFTENQGSTTDSSTRYGIIYDPADRKWMTFQYTGSTNNGNRITMGTRLAAATTGSRSTTHLGFTYDSTVNKEAFPIGSWIVPCNAKGVPFGYTLALGAGSLFTAFGEDKFSRIKQEHDFGEDQGTGIRSVYGMNVPTNAYGAITGSVLIETAVAHSGMPGLPEVTS